MNFYQSMPNDNSLKQNDYLKQKTNENSKTERFFQEF